MPIWLVGLFSFEAGSWFGSIINRIWSRNAEKRRDLLLYGVSQGQPLPFIDQQFEKRVGTLTPLQDKSARGMVKVMRWFTNTKLFELTVRRFVRDNWPVKTSEIDPEVKICL
jgi:hypothetical protein